MRIAIVWGVGLVLLGGCSYKPLIPSCAIGCQHDTDCPAGFRCAADFCQGGDGGACDAGMRATDASADGGGGAADVADAAAPMDAVTDTTGATDTAGPADAAPERPACLGKTTGMVTEYDIPTANAGATGIAVAADGTVWFTELNVAAMGRVDAMGCVTEVPLPAPAYDVTRGPQNRIWFSEVGRNRVGSITAAGVVGDVAVGSRPYYIAGNTTRLIYTSIDTMVLLDANGAMVGTPLDLCAVLQPFAVAMDSAGGVWSAEGNTSFHTMTFAVQGGLCFSPPALREVHGIATGPNGLVWVADPVSNLVGHFAYLSGQIDPLTTRVIAGARPTRIVRAPNGVAWFTEPGTNQVGRADEALNLNQILIPTANAGPAGIAAAADGTIWFVEQTANKVASIP